MEDAKQLGDMVRAGRDEVEELLGSRYAALEKDGALESREDDGAEAGTADGTPTEVATPGASPVTDQEGTPQLIPDEGTDRARADEAAPAAEETRNGEAQANR
jgi:hypothetical protein